jgi:hypothetical protein
MVGREVIDDYLLDDGRYDGDDGHWDDDDESGELPTPAPTHWITASQMLLARGSPKYRKRVLRALGWKPGERVSDLRCKRSLGICAHPRNAKRDWIELRFSAYANIVCSQPGHCMRLEL